MMKKYSIVSILCIALFICLYLGCSKDAIIHKYKTENVIIIVVDGARYTETWGFPTHPFIPYRSALAPEGVVCTNFYNNGDTYTNAGHTAITTGLYQTINNGGTEYPAKPSLFQYWLKYSKHAASDAWVIATKDKLSILSDCLDPLWKGTFRPNSDCGINGLGTGYRQDSTTYKNVITILNSYHPHLILVNFKQPDAAGHSADSLAYLQGIVDTDTYIHKIWNEIQSDDNYKDKTTLIVTNDHGRHTAGHLDGYVSHTDRCDGCKHIEFFGIGPDFKKNYTCIKSHEQIDIANTVAELMGFHMSTSTGRVMLDIFK